MPIKTAKEYERAVATFDQDRIQAMIDRIPWNINRAGKHYQKLLKQIYENTTGHSRKT